MAIKGLWTNFASPASRNPIAAMQGMFSGWAAWFSKPTMTKTSPQPLEEETMMSTAEAPMMTPSPNSWLLSSLKSKQTEIKDKNIELQSKIDWMSTSTPTADFRTWISGITKPLLSWQPQTQVSNFPEQAKQGIAQDIQQANQPAPQPQIQQPQAQTSAINDLLATVKQYPNATVEEIQTNFPEFQWNEDTIPDLLATVKQYPDATMDEIMQAFPELSWRTPITEWKSPLWYWAEIVWDIPWALKDTAIWIKEAAQNRFWNIKTNLNEQIQKKWKEAAVASIWQAALRNTWEVLWFIWDIFWEAIANVGWALVPEDIENIAKEWFSELAQTDIWQKWLAALKKWIDYYMDWKSENPEWAKNLEAVFNIASVLPVEKAIWAWLKVWKKVLSPLIKAWKTATSEWLSVIWRWASKVGKSLKKSALKDVEQALGATKQAMKKKWAKIAPWVLERWLVGSREWLLKKADSWVAKFGNAIDEFIDVNGIEWSIEKKKLIQALDIIEAETVFAWSVIDQTKFNAVKTFKEWIKKMDIDVIEWKKLRVLRKLYDDITKSTWWFWLGEEAKIKNELSSKLWNIIRKEIAEWNPDLAKLNKEYSFYANLKEVLDETQARTKPQSGMFRKAFATVVWWEQQGITDKVLWYIWTKLFLDTTSWATWKTLNAKIKNKFAKLLWEWDIPNINKYIKKINKDMPKLNLPEIRALPSPKTVTPSNIWTTKNPIKWVQTLEINKPNVTSNTSNINNIGMDKTAGKVLANKPPVSKWLTPKKSPLKEKVGDLTVEDLFWKKANESLKEFDYLDARSIYNKTPEWRLDLQLNVLKRDVGFWKTKVGKDWIKDLTELKEKWKRQGYKKWDFWKDWLDQSLVDDYMNYKNRLKAPLKEKVGELKATVKAPEASLVKEAKKYKSAEEFVKSKETIHHWGNIDDIADFNERFKSFGEWWNDPLSNLWINLWDRNTAQFFADRKWGKVLDFVLDSKKPKKTSYNKILNDMSQVAENNWIDHFKKVRSLKTTAAKNEYMIDNMFDSRFVEEYKEALINKGYDVIIYENTLDWWVGYIPLDKNVLKTKSQLTDIRNKSNKSKWLSPKK